MREDFDEASKISCSCLFLQTIRAIGQVTCDKSIIDAGAWNAGKVLTERMQEFREVACDELEGARGVCIKSAKHFGVDYACVLELEWICDQCIVPFLEILFRAEIGIKEMS